MVTVKVNAAPLLPSIPDRVVDEGTTLSFTATNLAVSADGKISFAWEARAGNIYRVQFKNNLSDAEWINVEPTIKATEGTASFSETLSGVGQRFYRIMQE